MNGVRKQPAEDAPIRSASGVPLPEVAVPEVTVPEVTVPGTAERHPVDPADGPGDGPGDKPAGGPDDRLGLPGEFPYTRGIRPGMYRERPWTIRQLAGFGTAQETNARYRMLLDGGATGINGVFDYPSLRAFDSDDPRAGADVGRGGVAVDLRGDFDTLFDGIPLDEVSVSLVSSQPIGAVPHLAMYVRSAERRGFAPARLAGTSQNDFLMETAITIAPEALPPAGSFRLACDLAEFALRTMPRWNPVSVSGYNYREAGADAVLEMALCLAHGQAVVRALLDRGLAAEPVLARVTFFLSAHSDFFEEVAKYRALRRMWAHWVRDELGVRDPRAQLLRYHVQTSGVTNSARHAHVNIARSALQGLAAVCGGTQSLHVNGYDEAVCIPSEHAALTALRTQYVLLHETGVAKVADPLGGSYLVEYLTDALEERARRVLERIGELGGIVAATERGWVHAELARTAFAEQKAIENGERLVVGVNTQLDGDAEELDRFELPDGSLDRQVAALERTRSRRDREAAGVALKRVARACRDGENVMPAVLDAVDADVTLGELGRVFRDELGRWEFPLWQES
ncbi:methylmalonyl-CoA mutase family protein [Microbispora sp. NBC_01189]|uniref:acyl-CoA mutase large subunit family protein n=1 Tax=Microbispora sp. NBC_01189 TaxID=2903583 RepID=UPI002E12ED0B|nr:methylmalonyl-CoA mutase family protein [Microbispora sp. NBC_01189]